MATPELIPHLFRTEYQKIVSVLCYLFGIEHVEIAEDIVSDTFLSATEIWGIKGLPENPTAWLYTVAKNKTKNYLKHHTLFAKKLSVELKHRTATIEEIEIDLSKKNINDSQLAMIFVVCHPCNPKEAQIALALNLLCGFNAEEIASAFLTNKEVIYKRLQRAKERLSKEKIRIEPPTTTDIEERLPTVLITLYLLFNEGYYSANQDVTLRKSLCLESMRLTHFLIDNEQTNQPSTNALLSLMCFHSSRFDARTNANGETILYDDQDIKLWNQSLIEKGTTYLNLASTGNKISKYHLEAGIAYWHTIKEDTRTKWESILQLYNQLLVLEYSPIAALNRTYALAKANGKEEAIVAAKNIDLSSMHLYHVLLGELYKDIDDQKAISHLQTALKLSKSKADHQLISKKINSFHKN
jgi:RNA polymerase sigma factor (sigma-70 family)